MGSTCTSFPLLLPIVLHPNKTVKLHIPLCTARVLTDEDFDEVYTVLNPARKRWREIGLKLKVHVSNLDDIEEKFTDNSRRLQEVLRIWLAKHPGWGALVIALRTKEVGEEGLAREVEMKYVRQLRGLTPPGGKLCSLHSIMLIRIASLYLKYSGGFRDLERGVQPLACEAYPKVFGLPRPLPVTLMHSRHT